MHRVRRKILKIFLYSLQLLEHHVTALIELCGKQPSQTRVSLIDNAADVITDGPDGWVVEIRNSIRNLGFNVNVVDLREFIHRPNELETILSASDLLWVGGGNMYYLRWLLREVNADAIIKRLVENGAVYCGWSAGACVVGPTLLEGEKMDDITQAKEVIYEGLQLVDFVMVPHIDSELFSHNAQDWERRLKQRGFKTIPLKDDQAILINEDTLRIL
jgi:dipeptidase E